MLSGAETAIAAAREASEKKAEQIVVYDLRGLSDVTDYFVICTALSKLQIRAIWHGIEKALKDAGVRPLGSEGDANTQWLLIDYGDVVVHVFSPELREYYNLEALWGDAPKLEWEKEGAA